VKDPLGRLRTLAEDAHPAVRLEAVRAASFFQTPEAAGIVDAAGRHPQDRFLSYTSMQALRTLKTFERPTSGVD
jgi:hypothetical protein